VYPGRLAVVAALSVALLLVWTTPTRAANLGFLFLIENGFTFTPIVDPNGPAAWVAKGQVRPIVNNKADFTKSLGTANVVVWSRVVPDPFFNSIGPIAALVTLTLTGADFIAHLGLIQTPMGFQTTIGLLERVGFSLQDAPWARGGWVFSDGTPAGGDTGDLIIGGVLVMGTPSPLGAQSTTLNQYFPTVPFGSDCCPDICHFVGASINCLGSFYGFTVEGGTARPVRSYNFFQFGNVLSGYGKESHLMVLQVGSGEYRVRACSAPDGSNVSDKCTLSGVGAVNGALAGDTSAFTFPGPVVGTFVVNLTPFLVLP
jgi:hypothetical protein